MPKQRAIPPGRTALPPQERILLAACELFCRDGIHATGIDRILAEAGVSKMTLYSRFGSKEALVREVLRREGAQWRSRFFAALDARGTDPKQRLLGAIAALRQWFEGGRFYGCAFMNAAAEHTKGEAWVKQLAAEHHGEILGYLQAQAEAAGLPQPAVLARQILLVMDGAIAALMVSGDAAVLDISERNLRAILAEPALAA